MIEQVPVLLTIFNRAEKVRRVIEALRQIKPFYFFLAADGPRPEYPEDNEKCGLARQTALKIDWSCDLKTRFLDKNIGCDPAVSSAIGWFFEHVDYGIILEDDCIPHPDFFSFCDELFHRYADDQRIMQISGFAPYAEREYPYDYHFSRTFRCSGCWGTWRRAWKYFRFSLEQHREDEAREMLKAYYSDYATCRRQYLKFCQFKKGIYNYWDFLWNMACYSQNGLCIVPEKNLCLNIGFDPDATHTKDMPTVFENLKVSPLSFPLRHPPFVFADSRPERGLERIINRSLPFKSRCRLHLRHALGTIAYFFETLP